MNKFCLVNNDFPLRLSKASIKKVNVLYFVNDTFCVLGDTVHLVYAPLDYVNILLTNILFNNQGDFKVSVVLHKYAVKSLTQEEKIQEQ